jgi:hypothetical protein
VVGRRLSGEREGGAYAATAKDAARRGTCITATRTGMRWLGAWVRGRRRQTLVTVTSTHRGALPRGVPRRSTGDRPRAHARAHASRTRPPGQPARSGRSADDGPAGGGGRRESENASTSVVGARRRSPFLGATRRSSLLRRLPSRSRPFGALNFGPNRPAGTIGKETGGASMQQRDGKTIFL